MKKNENILSDCLCFSVCSNNYLPQVFTLGESLKKTNPEIHFVIILVDKKKDEINYSDHHFEIIEVEEIEAQIVQLASKYNIIELSTCVKPTAFQFLFQKYPNLSKIVYFDPDIFVCNSINLIFSALEESEILLTPHILSPIPFDNKKPNDNLFLKFGVYNLGFLGVKKSANVFRFLEWWQDHTYMRGNIDIVNGQFVDQLPINLAPIFFENVMIFKNPGLNVAPWNFHERNLSFKNNTYFINETCPLIFLHISNFKPSDIIKINTKDWYQRVQLDDNKELKEIYTEYNRNLFKNSFAEYSILIPYYNRYLKKRKIKFIRLLINKIKSLLGI